MAGKGDKQRPLSIPHEEWCKRWDDVFKKSCINCDFVCDGQCCNEKSECYIGEIGEDDCCDEWEKKENIDESERNN